VFAYSSVILVRAHVITCILLPQDINKWTTHVTTLTTQTSSPAVTKKDTRLSQVANDEPPPLPRRRAPTTTGNSSTDHLNTPAGESPPSLPPRLHSNPTLSRPHSVVVQGTKGLNYIHMQFSHDGTLPVSTRERSHTTYSELVRDPSGDPTPADRLLRSSSDDELASGGAGSHDHHLDNVDLLRLNVIRNGNSHSNPDVSRSNPDVSHSNPDVSVTGDVAPPLPQRNKAISVATASEQNTFNNSDPFGQSDPFESGQDVSDPSDFYQSPRCAMVANGDRSSPVSQQQPMNVPPGYEECSQWVDVDDSQEYQQPLVPYTDQLSVLHKHPRSKDQHPLPKDQHPRLLQQAQSVDQSPIYQHPRSINQLSRSLDQEPMVHYQRPRSIQSVATYKSQSTSSKGDEGAGSSEDEREYVNPTSFTGDHDDELSIDEVKDIISPKTTSPTVTKETDEYSFPSELLIMPSNDVITPPTNDVITPPTNDVASTISSGLSLTPPPIPFNTHPSNFERQLTEPLPPRVPSHRGNSLGRTASLRPRHDREGWIMNYVQQGYSRDQVVRALAITQNDFNMASNILKEFVKMK